MHSFVTASSTWSKVVHKVLFMFLWYCMMHNIPRDLVIRDRNYGRPWRRHNYTLGRMRWVVGARILVGVTAGISKFSQYSVFLVSCYMTCCSVFGFHNPFTVLSARLNSVRSHCARCARASEPSAPERRSIPFSAQLCESLRVKLKR